MKEKFDKYCQAGHTSEHGWPKWSEKIEISETKVVVGGFDNDGIKVTAWFQERCCADCGIIETRRLYDFSRRNDL